MKFEILKAVNGKCTNPPPSLQPEHPHSKPLTSQPDANKYKPLAKKTGEEIIYTSGSVAGPFRRTGKAKDGQ